MLFSGMIAHGAENPSDSETEIDLWLVTYRRASRVNASPVEEYGRWNHVSAIGIQLLL